MPRKKSKKPDPRWDALLREAYVARDDVPPEAMQELLKVIDHVCDIGDRYQVPPRIMAAIVSAIVGHLALVEVDGNVHDNDHFDEFVEFGHAAIHVAVASARISGGWTPSGQN
jgi:hypothetical protein